MVSSLCCCDCCAKPIAYDVRIVSNSSLRFVSGSAVSVDCFYSSNVVSWLWVDGVDQSNWTRLSNNAFNIINTYSNFPSYLDFYNGFHYGRVIFNDGTIEDYFLRGVYA